MDSTWGLGTSCRVLRAGWMRSVIAWLAAMLVVSVAAATAAPAGAAPLTEFNLPTGTTANSLIVGTDGALWFVETTSTGKPEIGRITTAGVITQITTGFLPGAQLHAIAAGAGGTLWFSDIGTTKAIGEVTPSGQVSEIPAGTPSSGLNAGAAPYDMETAPDGTVWFEDTGTSPGVGAISPSGQITEYTDASATPLAPRDLTVDAQGNAWYTRQSGEGIGEVKLGAPAGTHVMVFPTTVPMANGITAGNDGNLWYTGNGYSVVGRITHAGVDTEFDEADGLQMGATPDAITAGPDGNVWFDDQDGPNFKAGKITPSGQITEYPLSGTPEDITSGIDGNLWLPQENPNGVDRVTPTGTVSFFNAGLNPGADPGDNTNIVSGPDGNLWFLDLGSPYAIVRADVQLPPVVTTGAAANVTTSSAQLEGTANARGSASAITVQYGTTPALGSTGPAGSEPAGDTSGAVAGTVTGLPAGTVIYNRLVASNAYGTTFGNTLSFTTAASPPPPAPATRTLHAKVGNQQITLTVPATTPCLAAGARLSLALSSTVIRGSKAAKLSFRRAAVFVDRGIRRTQTKFVTVHHHKHRRRITVYVPNATAGHLPGTLSPSLGGLSAGPHTLRITLTYTRTRHVKHRTVHTLVTKTIKTTFTVC
jgi:streptogramin lyase